MDNQLVVKASSMSFTTTLNVVYALFPLLFAWALTFPIIEDNGVSFALTNAYSGWIFCLLMLPASLLLFLGSTKKKVRIAIVFGILSCIAIPVVDVALDLEGLETAVRSFERYCAAMADQTGYRYFNRFKGSVTDYLGLAWLTIPALVLNIFALFGFKYQPRTDALPSLDELKKHYSSTDIKSSLSQFNTDKVRSISDELKKQAGNVDVDKLAQQLNASSSTFAHKKVGLVAAVGLLTAMLGFTLVGSSGPSESEVIEIVSKDLVEAGFDIEIHDYDISDCEEGLEGIAYRCRVTAAVTLAKKTGKTYTTSSSIEDEWRTFTYKDGFLEVKMEYLLDKETQQRIALSAISDLFSGSSNKNRNRW